ncbi:hypothetical protein FS842_004882 [Serendipita sp. 407]|nr:hypothetical protein FS842_004882 [Serendipita sp. 407]
MVKALVQHLLRQGPYTKAGSIVVLCMYLGQLAKLRDELQKSRIRVVLDSRDEDELRNREGDAILNDEDVPIKASDVKLSEQVLLRTVDNFQGEEADVVILSLVRNHGDEKAGTIGFLKSPNRVNVALTRARHGLFVFGNGDLLSSKSDMWTKVTNHFKETDCYGTGLPIACHLHPDTVQWVDSAEKLRQVSPEVSAAANPAGVLAKRDTHATESAGRTVSFAPSRFRISFYLAGIPVPMLPGA